VACFQEQKRAGRTQISTVKLAIDEQRPPRRSRIISNPSDGSSARIRTAAGNPSSSVTALKQWYMP
jgi:hypothetical protein